MRHEATNLHNRMLSEFRRWAGFAGSVLSSTAALGLHVPHVVGMVAQEQMIGAYASRIVTVVANEKPFGDSAELQFVGQSVRENRLTVTGSNPVSVTVARTFPSPTTVGLSHLVPETGRVEGASSSVVTPLATVLAATAAKVACGGREGGIANGTDNGVGGKLGMHFWSLLNRFRGAMPRVATNNAGAFAYPYFTRNGYEMGGI